eukprot:jgi/Mesvir1/5523/Mv25565-RA.1
MRTPMDLMAPDHGDNQTHEPASGPTGCACLSTTWLPNLSTAEYNVQPASTQTNIAAENKGISTTTEDGALLMWLGSDEPCDPCERVMPLGTSANIPGTQLLLPPRHGQAERTAYASQQTNGPLRTAKQSGWGRPQSAGHAPVQITLRRPGSEKVQQMEAHDRVQLGSMDLAAPHPLPQEKGGGGKGGEHDLTGRCAIKLYLKNYTAQPGHTRAISRIPRAEYGRESEIGGPRSRFQ